MPVSSAAPGSDRDFWQIHSWKESRRLAGIKIAFPRMPARQPAAAPQIPRNKRTPINGRIQALTATL